jgi:hypothetical protein
MLVKKLLFTILFTLVLSGSAGASCYNDLDVEWKRSGGFMVSFKFFNKADKNISIKSISILTEDNVILKSEKNLQFSNIKPYGRLENQIILIEDINYKLIKKAQYTCDYK